MSSSTQACPSARQIVAQLRAGHLEQRPNHLSPLRIDPTKPGHACAANQLQQKCLGLIVAGMADGHAIGADLDGASTQRFVAQPACGILNREALRGRIRPDVHGLDADRQTDCSGKFAAELLVAHRRRPQLMIDVRERDDAEAAMLGELAQEEGQRDGIRAAREPDEDTAPRRTQRVSADRAADLLQQTGH